jgi:uncharacterized protein YodC (DUF2158 family)
MAAKFKKDEVVGIKNTLIVGIIVRREVVEDEDMYLVRWNDESGELQERMFEEDQLFETTK